ncbi:DUF6542 domain-containing protein [Streptomyces sp. NPDC003401]
MSPPAAARRLPGPRLTGLGTGLFGVLLMLALGLLALLLGASQTAYGVLFLPVCVLCGLWVRQAELLAAPVVVPIAFAAGVLPLAEDGDGLGARLMALATALATQVGWLYGGTLLAALTVLARRVVLVARRRATTRRQVVSDGLFTRTDRPESAGVSPGRTGPGGPDQAEPGRLR